MNETATTLSGSRNPIARLARWLGWSEDQYLSAAGYVPLAAAFAAGVVLSYTSLVDLAEWLGFGRFERPFFPFAIDALVLGCYIAQARLAGVPGFGVHRLYIVGLGLLAGLLTASGNALHGLIVWKVVTLPLPWAILVAGSLVPALAMVGVGHALAIVRAAGRQRAVHSDGQLRGTLRDSQGLGVGQSAALEASPHGGEAGHGGVQRDAQDGRQLTVTDPRNVTRRLTARKQSAIVQPAGQVAASGDGQGAGHEDGQPDEQAARQRSITKGRITTAKNRQLRRAALIVSQEQDITGADLGRRLKVSAATGQRLLRELADQESPAPLTVVGAEENA